MTERTVDMYLKLPYTIEIVRDDSDGEIGYVARVVELPGLIAQGDKLEELGAVIEDVMRFDRVLPLTTTYAVEVSPPSRCPTAARTPR